MADPTADGGGGVLGYLAAVAGAFGTMFAGWRIAKAQGSNAALTEASNDGNIEAINTYKVMVAELRGELRAMQERADAFAKEAREISAEFYKAQGKIETLSEQVDSLKAEVSKLRASQQGATNEHA